MRRTPGRTMARSGMGRTEERVRARAMRVIADVAAREGLWIGRVAV